MSGDDVINSRRQGKGVRCFDFIRVSMMSGNDVFKPLGQYSHRIVSYSGRVASTPGGLT